LVDQVNYQLGEYDLKQITSPTESNESVNVIEKKEDIISNNHLIEKSISYENSGFHGQQSSALNLENGIIVTTRLQEPEDDDDDGNNVGFERLSGQGNKFGVFLLVIRKSLVDFIKKQKVCKTIVFVGFIFRYFSIDYSRFGIENLVFNWFYNLFWFCYECKIWNTCFSYN
jgi:hypothetical protein